jgi:hypothetical protein
MAEDAPATAAPVTRPANVPSARKLAVASGVASGVAALLLVVAVLPAEYGIDPLGTGRALGLTALAKPEAPPLPAPPPPGAALLPAAEGPFALYPAEYRVDSRELVLGPYEFVEFKYRLAQGASMVFSWTASGDVVHDFHGDPDGSPDKPQSFDKRPRRRADASFTAPFSGIHGWFWENPGGGTVTIRLTSAGFYTAAHEFRHDGSKRQIEVKSLAVPAAAIPGDER